MELIKQIKKDNISFRKNKNTVEANLTTLLVGEIQTALKKDLKGKSEEEISLGIVKKMLKTISSYSTETSEAEIKVLNSYLPSMMSVEEITDFVNFTYAEEIKTWDNKMPLIKQASQALKGKAEGKDIAFVIRSLK